MEDLNTLKTRLLDIHSTLETLHKTVSRHYLEGEVPVSRAKTWAEELEAISQEVRSLSGCMRCTESTVKKHIRDNKAEPVPTSVHQALGSAFYLVLEACCKDLMVTWGVVKVLKEDKLEVAVRYGHTATECDGLIDSIGGMCCSTQIAAIRVHKGRSCLAMPLATEKGDTLGVLMLHDKVDSNFTEDDECKAYRTAQVLTHILCQYPTCDITSYKYDFHKLLKYTPAPCTDTLKMHSFNSAVRHRKQLIIRDVKSEGGRQVFFDKHNARTVITSLNITDVHIHIKWLEQAWSSAVDLNKMYQEQIARSSSAFKVQLTKRTNENTNLKSQLHVYQDLINMRHARPNMETVTKKEEEWKVGDVAKLSPDVTLLEYCFDVARVATPVDLAEVAGTIGTVVSVNGDIVELRIGNTNSDALRGITMEVPVGSLITRAKGDGYMASYLRRLTFHGEEVAPDAPSVKRQVKRSVNLVVTKAPSPDFIPMPPPDTPNLSRDVFKSLGSFCSSLASTPPQTPNGLLTTRPRASSRDSSFRMPARRRTFVD
eukprot:TRINITY_DN26780_c0_g1_i1.p1 TRINITY_DN26780_c0_g1~~TRINITY_DN26780_c0_g1_i1.p1  ORF type:complete len:541 (+),score=104.28 TRINITY_DN26780_c0_g1_i1:1279-2901(+)